jgi:hypothetical protein
MTDEADVSVSVTRLHVRSSRFLPPFTWWTLRAHRQAKSAAGFIDGAATRMRDGSFWTATVWESAAHTRAYRNAEPHANAMRRIRRWCDEAAYARYTTTARGLPSWEEAHRRLVDAPRFTHLDHPSQMHSTKRLPEFVRPYASRQGRTPA